MLLPPPLLSHICPSFATTLARMYRPRHALRSPSPLPPPSCRAAMASQGAAADAGAPAPGTPPSAGASPTPDTRQLFGLSGDTSSGTAWQGSRYTAASKTFTKWWPAIYPGEWKLPNGMRYPFVWKLMNVRSENSQAIEEWTWDWVETPGLPSIAQVEQMLLEHHQQQLAQAQARAQQDAAAAAASSATTAASEAPVDGPAAGPVAPQNQ